MKTLLKNSMIVSLVCCSAILLSFDKATGWFSAGSKPNSYEIGIDKGSGEDGKNAASIKSIETTVDGFGTLMQNFSPEKYKGKRVRMTGSMKSKDVKDWAGFWLRIDKAESKESLGFDNMQHRAIKGTTDWQKYEIVLDVPDEASNMAFGGLLSGTGQIWFDDLNFEIVDNSVPTTGKGGSKSDKPKEPSNLDFED